ncbi:molybdopterin molybdotransferase MoeA [Rhizobium sp. S-51]|uniref:Molybdopterin molybdenumtransferase n=1 Tax=Rhizobium terricola TaxID=2728849 RepID=A0A7Y0B0V2_9HYPH|nr:gephyrin-like molybdotransferase Glp [Rhizobium terricola]NML77035.1 molybdopterin molybdotransferase MoeA [Rhizobium terricola]
MAEAHEVAGGRVFNGETDALIPVERAIEIAVGMVRPVAGVEDVKLVGARGRVLAADLRAARPMPRFDNSAMDGFAVRLADLDGHGPWQLRVAGTIAAGADPNVQPAMAGAAMRIFTGASVPETYDAVVMQEDCEDRDTFVIVRTRPRRGGNIRRAGEDAAKGDVLVAGGTRIEARHVGLLAGTGHTLLPVRRAPRIAVLSTGDELLAGDRGAAGIHDANRPMLISLAEGLGAEVTDLGICADDLDQTAALFRRLVHRFDMILTSGAASVGGRDHVRAALVAAGGSILSCKVAMKPGKPVFFGRLHETLVTGLPGNPLSAYVGFQLFVARQIGALLGVVPAGFVKETAIAGFDWQCKTGRTEYVPVRVVGTDAAATPVVDRLGHGSSASLLPLAQADGVAVLEAKSVAGACGAHLSWIPFGWNDFAWRMT